MGGTCVDNPISMRSFLQLLLLIAGALMADGARGAPAPTAAEAGGLYNLDRCLKTALAQNHEILKARERIQKNRGLVIEARAASIPRAAINVNLQQMDKDRIEIFNGMQFGTQNDWGVNLEVRQAIYTGGKVDSGIKRQKALEEAAVVEMQGTINDVLLEVRERFYAVLLARSLLAVQEQNLQLLEEELRTEKYRFEAGTVPSFNVLRAEVSLANARPALIHARHQDRIAVEELRKAIGLAPPATGGARPALEVEGQLGFEDYRVEVEQVLAAAATQRPDLRRIAKLVTAQTQGLRNARTGYQPQVDAFAGYGADKSQFSSSLKDDTHGWIAGVRGSWDIFDGLATDGRVRQAKSELSLAVLDEEQLRLTVDVEVRRAHSALVEAVDLVNASRKVVEQAEESLRLAKARFDVGAATQLDMLDAQVALTRARTNETQALYDFNVALARLNRAVGTDTYYTVKGLPEEPRS